MRWIRMNNFSRHVIVGFVLYLASVMWVKLFILIYIFISIILHTVIHPQRCTFVSPHRLHLDLIDQLTGELISVNSEILSSRWTVKKRIVDIVFLCIYYIFYFILSFSICFCSICISWWMSVRIDNRAIKKTINICPEMKLVIRK